MHGEVVTILGSLSFVMSICLSFSLLVSARVPQDGFFKFDTYMKICRENLNLVKIGQNSGHFTCRIAYVELR